MPDVEQTTLTIGGDRIFLNHSGDGKSEAILFLHGSGPGATGFSNWQFAVPALGKQFHCLAPDLIGFGKSEHPKNPVKTIGGWMDLWVKQSIALLDEMKIPQAHLAGNSMGGAIALHLLNRYPDRFKKVVFLGSIGTPHKITHQLDFLWGFYENPTAERMAQIIRWFAYNPAIIGGDLDGIAQMRLKAALDEGVRRSFSAMFPAPRQKVIDDLVVPIESIQRMKHPSLLVHGRDDVFVPLETSMYLLQHLPKVQLHVFGQCSHWIMIEYKDAFNRVISDFLEGKS